MAMTKVLVKAYIPTIDEKRGISLDDIIDGGSLRYVRPGQRNIGMNPTSLTLNQRQGVGRNIPYEILIQQEFGNKGRTIPGLLDSNRFGQINPNFNVQGNFVGPANAGFLINPDFGMPGQNQAVLLASTENPEFYRTEAQGARKGMGAEGYKYGGFDKDTVVEIPLPRNTVPFSFKQPNKEQKEFLEQFPQIAGPPKWFERRGPPAGIDELIASGKLQPLSLDQRIQPHESPFLDDDVTTKIATGEPMDLAWQLLKAPYDIDGEVFDRLYQGGREGDPDSGYWPMSHQEALTYALMGSDQERGMRTDGVPQIRVAPETDKMHYLEPDPETSMVGMAEKNAFPHVVQSREETTRDIERLLSELKDDPYADDDEDFAFNETQSDIAPFMDTGARDVSNAKRIAHIEEMLNRVRTGEPMDLAFDAIKKNLNRWFKEKWVDVSRKDKDGKHPPCGRSKASKSSKG